MSQPNSTVVWSPETGWNADGVRAVTEVVDGRLVITVEPRDLIADLNADMVRAAENLIEPGFPDTSSEYVRGVVELILDSSPNKRLAEFDPDEYRIALTAHLFSREA